MIGRDYAPYCLHLVQDQVPPSVYKHPPQLLLKFLLNQQIIRTSAAINFSKPKEQERSTTATVRQNPWSGMDYCWTPGSTGEKPSPPKPEATAPIKQKYDDDHPSLETCTEQASTSSVMSLLPSLKSAGSEHSMSEVENDGPSDIKDRLWADDSNVSSQDTSTCPLTPMYQCLFPVNCVPTQL